MTRQYTRAARLHTGERGRQALRDGIIEPQDVMAALLQEISLLMPGADLGTLMDCANDGIKANGTPEEALWVVRMGGLIIVDRSIKDEEENEDERTVH